MLWAGRERRRGSGGDSGRLCRIFNFEGTGGKIEIKRESANKWDDINVYIRVYIIKKVE